MMTMATKKLNVLLACEYQIVCLGIASYIEAHSPHRITSRVANLKDLYKALQANGIDVVLVELSLLKPAGLADIKKIIHVDPAIKVIVVARSEKQPFISKSIDCGALGYISLQCSPDEIIECIETTHRNQKYLSKDVAYDFAIASLNNDHEQLSVLTTREYQVFSQLAQGICVLDIADAMKLSPKTVHVYRANILEKLKLESIPELTLLALKYGVISIDAI
jgi:DNA-binding NarL/FixJ family response regulator